MTSSHMPPYRLETPLAHTTGIASQLKSLCCKGNRWRDLADALGLSIRDQRDIEARSQGNDIHHLLVDRLVDIYGDKANILTLALALLKLGQQGKEVLAKMVEGELLQSLEEMKMAEGNPWVDEDKRSENTRASEIPSTTAEDTGAARNYGFGATLGSTGSATPRKTGSARIADSTESRPNIIINFNTARNVRIACTKESVVIPLDRAGQTREGTLPPATVEQGSVNTNQAAPKKMERIVLKIFQSWIYALLGLE